MAILDTLLMNPSFQFALGMLANNQAPRLAGGRAAFGNSLRGGMDAFNEAQTQQAINAFRQQQAELAKRKLDMTAQEQARKDAAFGLLAQSENVPPEAIAALYAGDPNLALYHQKLYKPLPQEPKTTDEMAEYQMAKRDPEFAAYLESSKGKGGGAPADVQSAQAMFPGMPLAEAMPKYWAAKREQGQNDDVVIAKEMFPGEPLKDALPKYYASKRGKGWGMSITGYDEQGRPLYSVGEVSGEELKRPDTGEAKEIAQGSMSSEMGTQLLSAIDRVDPGGLSGLWLKTRSQASWTGAFANLLDNLTKDEARVVSLTENLGKTLMSATRGAAIGPLEEQRFEPALPTLGQPKELFVRNVITTLDNIQELNRRRILFRRLNITPPESGYVPVEKMAEALKKANYTHEEVLEELLRLGY